MCTYALRSRQLPTLMSNSLEFFLLTICLFCFELTPFLNKYFTVVRVSAKCVKGPQSVLFPSAVVCCSFFW